MTPTRTAVGAPELPGCEGCNLTRAYEQFGRPDLAAQLRAACPTGRLALNNAGVEQANQPECAGPLGASIESGAIAMPAAASEEVSSEGLTTPQRLGQRLRQARLARNLTQGQAAGSMFSEQYLRAVERGQVRPSLGALERLAERLQVPITELLGNDSPEANPEQTGSDEEENK